jgi:hypothetical protein
VPQKDPFALLPTHDLTAGILLPKPQEITQPVEKERLRLPLQSSGFQFVNLHNGQQPRPSSESQAMIRSQAMKSFLRGRSEIKIGNEVSSIDLEQRPKMKERNGEELMFRLLPKEMQELPKRARMKRRALDKKGSAGSKYQNKSLRSQNRTESSLKAASNLTAIESLHIRNLGSENLDPFHSLPFPVTERTQDLLRYCKYPEAIET